MATAKRNGLNLVPSWNPKQPEFKWLFHMAIEILYIGNGCLGKHQFLSGCLGFQIEIKTKTAPQHRWKHLRTLFLHANTSLPRHVFVYALLLQVPLPFPNRSSRPVARPPAPSTSAGRPELSAWASCGASEAKRCSKGWTFFLSAGGAGQAEVPGAGGAGVGMVDGGKRGGRMGWAVGQVEGGGA